MREHGRLPRRVAIGQVRECVRRLGCNVRVARLEGARERVQQKCHGERFKHRVDAVSRNP